MIDTLFILFILFQNIIIHYLPSVTSYWDEAMCLVLGFLLFIGAKGKLYKSDFACITLLFCVIIIGVIGNVTFSYQKSYSAIIRDIVGFIKFPLVFIALYRMKVGYKLSKRLLTIIPFLKLIEKIILVFGILSLFINIGMSQSEIRNAIHPYMFLYTHPTYLTTGSISILCLLNAAQEASIKDDIIILSNIALAMRTKGLVFIAVYIFLKYGSKWLRKIKVFYWAAIMTIIFIVAQSKLQLYASFSGSPRESLYAGAITLAQTYFPIGTGFATYASHISGKYFSEVYNFIHISGLYTALGEISPDIGDAGIPYYVGQFGILGIALIGILIYKMIRMSFFNLDQTRKIGVIALWMMIAVSIPTEAILINNGAEIGFTMAMVSLLARRNMFAINNCMKETEHNTHEC